MSKRGADDAATAMRVLAQQSMTWDDKMTLVRIGARRWLHVIAAVAVVCAVTTWPHVWKGPVFFLLCVPTAALLTTAGAVAVWFYQEARRDNDMATLAIGVLLAVYCLVVAALPAGFAVFVWSSSP